MASTQNREDETITYIACNFEQRLMELKKNQEDPDKVLIELNKMILSVPKNEIFSIMKVLDRLQYDGDIQSTVFKFSEDVYRLINAES
jgi:hypothetical protein